MISYDPVLPQAPRIPSLYEQLLGAPGDGPIDTRVIDLMREYGREDPRPGFVARMRQRISHYFPRT